MQGNKPMPVEHPSDVTGLICSNCIQVLLASSQEKIRAAYQLAIDKEMLDKARVLKTFIGEEENVPETHHGKGNMDRARDLRQARATH